MLTPYTGPWTFDEAAHLLRRTIFGPTKARILQAVSEGLEGSITTLMTPPSPVDPPIYYDFEDDPLAGIGETWTDKVLDGNITGIYFSREKTLWAWWFMRMNRDQQTIMEKLTLFWHNHFVISEAGHANMQWDYFNLLRDFALGDFRELTKRITIDRAMLIYLNGTSNYASEPNENYARELLELFTIGKGPLVAPGDYTNYTEQDIGAFAKALTGWTAWTAGNSPAELTTWGHDTSTKQLSHRFDDQTIPNAGADEYKNVIDIIFGKDEVAFHICRRLYIWFVHYDINDTIEAEIIAPMAQILLDNNYQIQPALEALLKSEHFYSNEVRGCMIKNTLDCFFSSYNTFQVAPPTDFLVEYKLWVAWYWEYLQLEMGVFKVPSVAGWRAYYQAPQYYRDWINSASLALRKRMLANIKWLTQYVSPETQGYNFLAFISTFESPSSPVSLIDEACQLIYARPMTEEQKAYFKESLIPGLPDFEWTVEYQNYLDDPTNDDTRIAVENKLHSMFTTMMNVPEFQLS
ncbi:MAG: hypothetical protein ACI8P3_001047 [Saprospiraceae bacterium]|jgi:hypothetical protein